MLSVQWISQSFVWEPQCIGLAYSSLCSLSPRTVVLPMLMSVRSVPQPYQVSVWHTLRREQEPEDCTIFEAFLCSPEPSSQTRHTSFPLVVSLTSAWFRKVPSTSLIRLLPLERFLPTGVIAFYLTSFLSQVKFQSLSTTLLPTPHLSLSVVRQQWRVTCWVTSI